MAEQIDHASTTHKERPGSYGLHCNSLLVFREVPVCTVFGPTPSLFNRLLSLSSYFLCRLCGNLQRLDFLLVVVLDRFQHGITVNDGCCWCI